MDQHSTDSAASALCASCGMCCNGVLFFGAVLQPDDDPRALAAMGLRIKRHAGVLHLLQPCPAHQNGTCQVYQQRPVRCRIFECRQLIALSSGETTEAEVLEKIQQAGALVSRVRALLEAAGDHRQHKSLVSRYASVFSEPLDPSPEAVQIRGQLESLMNKLEDLLEKEFRAE